jgi:6-phosphogluconolactonase
MQIYRASGLAAGLLLIALLAVNATGAQRTSQEYFVYFGTYTRTASKGIYAYRFQPATGTLTSIGLVAETPNPSFIASHPNGRFLYATNEYEANSPPGRPNTISAFAIDPATGQLSFLNNVSAQGAGPCHISIDKTGAVLLVANYGSGSVAALPIGKDGRLGEATASVQHRGSSVDPARQRGPHAHFIAPSPDNRFALAVDLGIDRVIAYPFDAAKGALDASNPPSASVTAGSGPRHLAFHPNGRYVYVNGEMSSTVSAFAYQARTATLKILQTLSTLPGDFAGTSTTAEVQVDPTGRFLYVSNRGLDSIAVFGIDQKTGLLRAIEQTPTGGKTPRYFTLDPSGAYLLAGNQNSNTVIVYRVDAKSGHLTPAQTLTDVPEPVCIVFVPVQR